MEKETVSVIGRAIYSACVCIDLLVHFTTADGGSLTKVQVVAKCVLIIVFSLAETVVLVLGLSGGRDKANTEKIQIQPEKQSRKKTRRQKIGFVITRTSGIVLIASVLYWHFYQFWGC